MQKKIVIATRQSPLAIKQTEEIRDQLINFYPELDIEFLGITTEADKRLDVVLTEIGGKGLFIKELEEALLDGRADIAVHSMKDLPMDLLPDFAVPAIAKRMEPRDVFVSNHYQSYLDLPTGATVGTASLRRQTQLRALRPDLRLQNLRGNMNTRLKRLDNGDFDAIILAGAGLLRLGFADRICSYFSTDDSLPPAGQGSLGIECRADDAEIIALLTPLNDSKSNFCITAERAVCRKLNGGCKVPVAAFAEYRGEEIYLRALVSNRDASIILRAQALFPQEQADEMGTFVAEDLLAQGAEAILNEFYND